MVIEIHYMTAKYKPRWPVKVDLTKYIKYYVDLLIG